MRKSELNENPFKSVAKGFAKGFQAGKKSPDALNRAVDKALDPDTYGDDKPQPKKAEWKPIPVTPVKVDPNIPIPKSVKEIPPGTGFKDPKGIMWQWAGQSWVKKMPGGWQGGQINNNSAFKMYIDALKDGRAYKPIKRESDMSDTDTTESGLQRYTGIKKYGKKGFEKLQKAGRDGASEEEKGKIKDQILGKKKTNEGLGDLAHRAEQDHEVQMARAELYKIAKYAIKLHDLLKGVSEAEGLDGWVQSKITKAANDIGSVYHHMDYEEASEAAMPETNAKPKIVTKETNDPYKKALHAKLAESKKK